MDAYRCRRIDELASINRGAVKLAGDELGVEAFGLQVLDFPPGFDRYPAHDHAADGQEEVYVVLDGSAEFEIAGERIPAGRGTAAARRAARLRRADAGRRPRARRDPVRSPAGMTRAQRLIRLATTLVVSQPRLWRLLRGPFRRYFDALAPRWDGIMRAANLDALDAALAEVPAPRHVLDVGTGTGAAAFFLARRFPDAQVTGVDVAPAMIAAARAKVPAELAERVRFVEADATALPVASGACDLVTLVNMVPFFDELARVLAPGGALLISYSAGPDTPIWVPPQRLRAELGARGFGRFADFAAGAATCLLAREQAPQ